MYCSHKCWKNLWLNMICFSSKYNRIQYNVCIIVITQTQVCQCHTRLKKQIHVDCLEHCIVWRFPLSFRVFGAEANCNAYGIWDKELNALCACNLYTASRNFHLIIIYFLPCGFSIARQCCYCSMLAFRYFNVHNVVGLILHNLYSK